MHCLQHSEVLRDLGGTVLRSPELIRTTADPAITYTDPQLGEEAALSAFDANLAASAYFENNDNAFNNTFIGNNGIFQQDLGDYRVELAKRAATGTRMALRHVTNYDHNNSIGNRFGSPSSSWFTYLDAEVRQPLLQGAGVSFNRIAGPNGQPGLSNGVLIARIRSDISVAEFEIGVRDLISNVENAYWDLYFAYRDFHAKVNARDQALRALRIVKNRNEQGMKGAEADELLQAEEQYWRFKADVQDAVNGRLVDSSRTFNGSTGGTFRGIGGVRVAERRLRLIMGMPINDGVLLRPSDEPTTAPVRFDWELAVDESVENRPELRRQRWVVKQRELELTANKNFLLPRLDAVGRYRVRGFGKSLTNSDEYRFASAADEFLGGDFQEWQMGVEFSAPLGFRQGHAAVRNAELQLSRERKILREQVRQINYGLSNAVGDVERSFDVLQTQFYRHQAAQKQVDYIEGKYKEFLAPIDLVLEAHRRLLDAEIRYYQARADYVLALKNVHFEKGTLLNYAGVSMGERPSSRFAMAGAADLFCRRKHTFDYVCRDSVVGRPRHRNSSVQSHAEVFPTDPLLTETNETTPAANSESIPTTQTLTVRIADLDGTSLN